MGIFNRITGRSDPKAEDEPAPSSSSSSHQEELRDPSSGGSSYGPPTMVMPNLGGNLGGFGSPNSRLYDPYEGISTAVGGKKSSFKLPDRTEFVFEEEAAVRRRGWTENLQFYTGGGYTAGGAVGISAGVYKFLTSKSEVQGPETLKLKTNRLLNSSGSFARPLGNGCGILGLFFASFESLLSWQLEFIGLPDAAHSMLAGAAAGALFRSPRGPRQAAAAAAVGVVGGTGIAVLRATVFPSL